MQVPLELCEARDPKGLYKKARAGALKGFTGAGRRGGGRRARARVVGLILGGRAHGGCAGAAGSPKGRGRRAQLPLAALCPLADPSPHPCPAP
jgi:hypothetical protein